MKTVKTFVAAAFIAGLSALPMQSAHAWGGWGPWGGDNWGSDWGPFDGDGFGDFNMSMNTRASGWGRGHGYNHYAPYYGPYAYGPYGYGAPYGVAPIAPVAPVAEATK